MKFSIRDALWLTALVAVGLAWWIDRTRRAEEPPPPADGQRRYEVLMTGENHDVPYLFDPRTGEMWERYGGDRKWNPYARFPEK
jgi:hypothetical protein